MGQIKYFCKPSFNIIWFTNFTAQDIPEIQTLTQLTKNFMGPKCLSLYTHKATGSNPGPLESTQLLMFLQF
jgi:hypothetical protein